MALTKSRWVLRLPRPELVACRSRDDFWSLNYKTKILKDKGHIFSTARSKGICYSPMPRHVLEQKLQQWGMMGTLQKKPHYFFPELLDKLYGEMSRAAYADLTPACKRRMLQAPWHVQQLGASSGPASANKIVPVDEHDGLIYIPVGHPQQPSPEMMSLLTSPPVVVSARAPPPLVPVQQMPGAPVAAPASLALPLPAAFCSQCGTGLQGGNFCISCGAPHPATTQASPTEAAAAVQGEPIEPTGVWGGWDSMKWDEMAPFFQKHWMVLGYTKEGWEKGIEAFTADLEWADLSPECQASAAALGYTPQMWDDDGEAPKVQPQPR